MKNREFLLRLGRRIKELRNTKNFSQEKLAELCELHRTYIGMVERGEKNITVGNLLKICNALNITLKELFDYEN